MPSGLLSMLCGAMRLLPGRQSINLATFKLALTEDEPTIKPYNEAAWAELADSRRVPIEVSLELLDALHLRWVTILRSMDAADFRRGFKHPEQGRVLTRTRRSTEARRRNVVFRSAKERPFSERKATIVRHRCMPRHHR